VVTAAVDCVRASGGTGDGARQSDTARRANDNGRHVAATDLADEIVTRALTIE
jgi:hypothetical protein